MIPAGAAPATLAAKACRTVGALVALAVSCSWPASAQPASESAALLQRVLELPADAARGRQAFEECSGCHRKDASGRALSQTPRLAGQHASVITKQLLDIRSGLRSNPPMLPRVQEAELSLQALADIALYLQGLPMADNNAKGSGQALAQGRQLYERDCVACHGAAGQGQAPLFVPLVAAQHHPYLLRELAFIRDGKRGNSNPAMAAMLQNYSAEDLQAVADHLSRMPPPRR